MYRGETDIADDDNSYSKDKKTPCELHITLLVFATAAVTHEISYMLCPIIKPTALHCPPDVLQKGVLWSV